MDTDRSIVLTYEPYSLVTYTRQELIQPLEEDYSFNVFEEEHKKDNYEFCCIL